MLQFQGFKPDALNRMAKTMGYSGDMGEFNKFLNENPEKQEMMDVYSEKAKEMMMGGYVKGYAEGGVVEKDYRAEYQAAVESARQARANGMMGRVQLLGEMSYEDFAASRRFQDQLTAQYGPNGGLGMAAPAGNTMPMSAFNSAGMPFTGTGNDGYGSMSQGPEDFYNSNRNPFDPRIQQPPQGNPSTEMLTGQQPTGPQPNRTLTYEDAQMRAMQQDIKSPQQQANINAAMALGPGGVYNIPSTSIDPPLIQQPFDPRSGQPVQRNPNIVSEYYDSPEYTAFRNNPSNRIGTADVRNSPYFGRQGSGSVGGAADRAYIDYLNRSGQTSYLQGGADYTSNVDYDKMIESRKGQAPLQTASGQADGLNRGMYNNPPPVGQTANPQATAPVSPVDYTQGPVPQSTGFQGQTIADQMANRAYTPGLPYGATVQPVGTAYNANQVIDPTTGQLSAAPDINVAQATSMGAVAPTATDPRTMAAATTQAGVQAVTDSVAPAQGTVDPRAQATAQQTTRTSVEALTEAQGTATTMSNPVTRSVQAGELVSGVANAQTAATFTEQTQAAQATPTNKATVQGQLEGLMAAFEGGNTPAWAAGAMRNVTTQMANRGLGASSMAAQALIQGAMESALPLAQADASIFAQFETQNLSNRQQRAMLAAQQRATFMGMEFDQEFQARVQNSARIGDIANMNFTADQQVALENSRVASTVNLTNLSNSQAMVMAEAAALSQLDMANLSNRQQAAVQNAQNFMQMDMTNLSNEQQTGMFKAQSRIQSLFTDQAATNAARQFNASSQAQTDQFFASLASTTSQFNASQSNAQSQFNAGETNAVQKFNAELDNQRDQFNAQNSIVISQNNAQWRREIATADTVAVNRANEINARSILDMSEQSYANLWQYYADSMEWAWTSAESQLQRTNDLAVVEIDAKARKDIAEEQSSSAAGEAVGGLIGTLGSAYISKMF